MDSQPRESTNTRHHFFFFSFPFSFLAWKQAVDAGVTGEGGARPVAGVTLHRAPGSHAACVPTHCHPGAPYSGPGHIYTRPGRWRHTAAKSQPVAAVCVCVCVSVVL